MKLRQLSGVAPFLFIATLDSQSLEDRNVIPGVLQGCVLGALLFVLYIHMWFGLENMFVSYADDATDLAHIPKYEI